MHIRFGICISGLVFHLSIQVEAVIILFECIGHMGIVKSGCDVYRCKQADAAVHRNLAPNRTAVAAASLSRTVYRTIFEMDLLSLQ